VEVSFQGGLESRFTTGIAAHVSVPPCHTSHFRYFVEKHFCRPLCSSASGVPFFSFPPETGAASEQNTKDPTKVDGYGLIINGQEIFAGLSELNGPGLPNGQRWWNRPGRKHQRSTKISFGVGVWDAGPPVGWVWVFEPLSLLWRALNRFGIVILFRIETAKPRE